MKTALAALVLAAVPAAAQDRGAQSAYDAAQGAIAAQAGDDRAALAKAQARSRTLETTLTAMNDGVKAGEAVLRSIEARKITVHFGTQAEAVKSGAVNGGAAILLSDALPAHPRVYAPLIAAEAAKGMYADMPACAEREYMRRATAARVFQELGGDFKALPVVDGDAAPAVQAAVSAWATDSQTALDQIARETRLPTIPVLEVQAPTERKYDELHAANKRFTAFLFDEMDARSAAHPL